MAEYCLKSYNELNEANLTEDDVVLSNEATWCEGCSKMCKVIIEIKDK
jgi:hypothetical protein